MDKKQKLVFLYFGNDWFACPWAPKAVATGKMSTPKACGVCPEERRTESMKEPYRSQFARLIREGVANRDIHDSAGLGSYDAELSPSTFASDAFVERELSRVAMHSRSLCPTLVAHVGSSTRILDVGCGTGGTTVALALSSLNAEEVIGVDANKAVLEASTVRALGYDLPPKRVRFLHVPAGSHLDFPTGYFDLATCVSVLEFIATEEAVGSLQPKSSRWSGTEAISSSPRQARSTYGSFTRGDLSEIGGSVQATLGRVHHGRSAQCSPAAI